MELNFMVVIRKVNSKAFAIPILTGYIGRCSQNRDSKWLRINFSFLFFFLP